jgi:hypothetical protein
MTDNALVVRRARKQWTCQARTHHVDCGITIRPGTQYVEYLGESHAYASGIRYSTVCARETWGEDSFDVPTCEHGIPLDSICVDCREARHGVPPRDLEAL